MIGVALIFFLLVAAYSLFSKPLDNSRISLPCLFAVGGFLLACAIKAMAPQSDLLTQSEHIETIRLLAEATLVIVLFSDASLIHYEKLKKSWMAPARLLAIGMPLSILFGMGAAALFAPGGAWPGYLLIAAILAATDASLAKPVVTDPRVPEPIRETINVESGLNDGIAVPIVIIAATLIPGAGAVAEQAGERNFVNFILLQLVAAPLIGGAVAFALAKAFNATMTHDGETEEWAVKSGWFSENYQSIFFLATAALCYLIADIFESSGFIAAFVGGVVFGNVKCGHGDFIEKFMDAEGQLFAMATFFMFGLVMAPVGLAFMDWRVLALALCFLTVIRMVPVFISLIGVRLKAPIEGRSGEATRLTTTDKLFIGWFGPRGLASILFALLFLQNHQFDEHRPLLSCIVVTVALSIVLHGVTASPLAERLFARKS